MFVDDLITRADNWIDSEISAEEKIEVISNLENDFYSKRFFKYEEDTIDIVAEQDTYSLSTKDYTFDDIEVLKIDDVAYKKMSMRDNYNYCYYPDGTDIIINPEPVSSETDGITIVHLYKPTEKTTLNDDTATLDIVEDFGARFKDLYLFALLHKYCLFNRDFDLANNYAMYYNVAEAQLHEYIVEHRPSTVAELRKNPKVWR